jgi:hypothetical protein
MNVIIAENHLFGVNDMPVKAAGNLTEKTLLRATQWLIAYRVVSDVTLAKVKALPMRSGNKSEI